MTPIVESKLEVMAKWVRDREAIRIAKEAGAPKPWTDDPLLRDWRWCNVSRMDDKVSRDLMAHWYRDADATTQLVAATLGRLVNWPDALLDGTDGKPFELPMLDQVEACLLGRSLAGTKWLTAAYIVPGVPGQRKVDSIMAVVRQVRVRAVDLVQGRLQSTWAALVEIDRLGSFLAGQICADLAYLETGRHWPDRFSWAPVGPGSSKGMNIVRGRDPKTVIRQAQFDEELVDLINALRPRIAEIDDDRKLGAQDYQSICCEFSKLSRMMDGSGAMRSRYPGGADAPNQGGASSSQGELFE